MNLWHKESRGLFLVKAMVRNSPCVSIGVTTTMSKFWLICESKLTMILCADQRGMCCGHVKRLKILCKIIYNFMPRIVTKEILAWTQCFISGVIKCDHYRGWNVKKVRVLPTQKGKCATNAVAVRTKDTNFVSVPFPGPTTFACTTWLTTSLRRMRFPFSCFVRLFAT